MGKIVLDRIMPAIRRSALPCEIVFLLYSPLPRTLPLSHSTFYAAFSKISNRSQAPVCRYSSISLTTQTRTLPALLSSAYPSLTQRTDQKLTPPPPAMKTQQSSTKMSDTQPPPKPKASGAKPLFAASSAAFAICGIIGSILCGIRATSGTVRPHPTLKLPQNHPTNTRSPQLSNGAPISIWPYLFTLLLTAEILITLTLQLCLNFRIGFSRAADIVGPLWVIDAVLGVMHFVFWVVCTSAYENTGFEVPDFYGFWIVVCAVVNEVACVIFMMMGAGEGKEKGQRSGEV